MDDMVDVLIVGQGICGSCLALQLIEEGKRVHIIDRGHEAATSRIAAGLINPITGRRYSKSWMIDTLLPFARAFYKQLQEEFEQEIYRNTPIYRILSTPRAVNYWDERSADPEYTEYMSDDTPTFSFIKVECETGTVTGGMHVYMNRLIEVLRDRWMTENILSDMTFQYEKLKKDGSAWKYKNIRAERIVFSEGPAVAQNPYFNHLPWDFIKGEALYLKVRPDLLDAPMKQTLFLIPWERNTLWVGTTYDRENADAQPSSEGEEYILNRLKDRYEFDYEILDHFAANRPAVHDHRPIIGEHPEHGGLYSFNGMGTKAASLAPWFAQHLIEHIYRGTDLLPEVDLSRFQ